MRLRHLEAFRATMIAGTVSGAADILKISQPAASRLLDKLETQFSITLFDRRSGRLVPTPEAHLLYEEVERAFSSIDKIRNAAFDIHLAKVGQINIATLPSLGLGFIPAVIRKFAEDHPAVRISHDIQVSAKVEEWAASQQLDFGLAEFPFKRSGFDIEDFCQSPYVLAVPANHELAKKHTVTPRDLTGIPMIIMSLSCTGRHRIDHVFQAAGVEYEVIYETPFASAICSLVSKGLGVGLVDPFTAHDYCDQNIVFKKFEPEIIFHVGILFPGHRPISKVAKHFLATMKSTRLDLGSPTT